MPSKTSSFNKEVNSQRNSPQASILNKGIFINNLRRFWLITFAYSLFLLFFVMGYLSSEVSELNSPYITDFSTFGSDIFSQSGDFMTVLQGFFCLISGLAVFSYIHFQKNTAMVHSLPLRRETLFTTNYLSGLFLVAFPLLFNTLILVTVQGVMNFPRLDYAFIWLGMNLVITFLLYTFTVFAGMFTGHMAAQAIFFLIYNFLAFFLEAMINLVLNNFLFGFVNSSYKFEAWSPLYYMNKLFTGFGNNEGKVITVIFYFIAGLVFLISSYFLYKKRHMEVASDVISFQGVKPVFRYSVAFCSSALLGSILVGVLGIRQQLVPYIITYLVGGFIGYFSAEMLLRKTFRVFKAYKGFLIFGVVLTLLLCSINFDFYGYERYVPGDKDIELMFLSQYPDQNGRLALRPEDYDADKHRYIFHDSRLFGKPPAKLDDALIKELRQYPGIAEDREAINKARQIHSYIIKNEALLKKNRNDYYEAVNNRVDQDNYRSFGLYFAYRLKNGSLVERQYSLTMDKENTELEQLLRDYLAIPETVKRYEPLLTKTVEDILSIKIYYNTKEGERIEAAIDDEQEFLDTYQKDILLQDPLDIMYRYSDDRLYNIDIRFEFHEEDNLLSFGPSGNRVLYKSYENTLNYLLGIGVFTPEQLRELESKY